MTTLWQELEKIIGQIRGSQNIFGYKSTVANQMYLFYCFSGKIYFTDKINSRVKYFWYIVVSSDLAISNILSLMYFLYGEESDVVMMLNAANVISTSNVATFGFPLISYICSGQIESAIQLVDRILTIDEDHLNVYSKQSRVIVSMRNVLVMILSPFLVFCVVYMFTCFIDVVVFFSEDKVKNNFYYMAPIPLIERYGSPRLFLFFNGLSTFAFGMFLFKLISVFAVVLYWNAIYCNELAHLRDEFDNRSRYLMKVLEEGTGIGRNFKEWSQHFHWILKRGTGRFQEIVLLINYLQAFVEVIGSLVTVLAFFYGIGVLYICLSEDLLFVVKLKYLAGTLACTFSTFVLYWVGQNLENSITEVSTAVYSTPWYHSIKVRKYTHLLLRQIGTVKNFAIIKVYGLSLKNFSRYLHGVLSYTNLLRRLNLE